MMKNKWLRLMLVCMIALGLQGTAVKAELFSDSNSPKQNTPRIKINGQSVQVNPQHPATFRQNLIYVPVDFFEHPSLQLSVFAFQVQDGIHADLLNSKTKITLNTSQASYTYGNFKTSDSFGIGETKTASWEGEGPYTDGNKLMVPLKEISERMGISVKWDKQSKTALLITDAEYQSQLDSVEEWEEWLGQSPVDEDDPYSPAVTEKELIEYITDQGLHVVDYEIVSKYKAIVLEIGESEASLYTLERLRNGGIASRDVEMASGTDDEGFTVLHAYGYIGVTAHESTKIHDIEYFVVTTSDGGGNEVKEKRLFEGKQGVLVKLPNGDASGTVDFYGQNGFVHHTYFW